MPAILVIDDDEQARRVVREALVRAGYDVLEAVDGEEGSRIVREARPALVITDLLMPNKEGLETIQELRRDNRALPIIAMSGGGQRVGPESILQLASMLGADHVLQKPFALRDLTDAVARLLGDRGSA